MRRFILLAAVCLLARPWGRAVADQPPATDDAAVSFFESRIRPLLSEHCWECHGSDKQKGNVRLDSRAALVAEGDTGPVIVPGAPEESRLLEVVGHDDVIKMPPKSRLPKQAIEDLGQWVRMGAPWPESPSSDSNPTGIEAILEARRQHWAFRPVKEPTLPRVRDGSWPRTAVDFHILARLEAHDLAPSAGADRRTLIRRATFDVVGLPPTLEEVDRFLGDPDPDDVAYARLIDRLLASPHYGERWGRYWLDVARYADSKGYVYSDREEERYPFSYTYRDYVIRAFNQDLPYDRFLLEQIAADCLPQGPEADRSCLAAMGFLTLGRRFVNNVHDIIDDRLDVIFRGTQGLTIGCARCHDHKYDPIPTRDYYSLYGVLAGVTEQTVPITSPPPCGTAHRLYETELESRRKALVEKFAARKEELSRRLRNQISEYLVAVPEADKLPGDEFYVILRDPNDINPVFVHRWKAYIQRNRRPGVVHPIFGPWHAYATLSSKDFPEASKALERRPFGDPATGSLNRLVSEAFSVGPPQSMREVAARYGELLFKVHESWLDALERARKAGAAPPQALDDPDAEALRQVLYAIDSPTSIPAKTISEIEPFFDEKTRVELAQLQMKIDQWNLEATAAPPQALVLRDTASPVNPRVFRRGNPSMMGEVVPRQFLTVLSDDAPRPFPNGGGRLDLARAIVRADNPLTARVLVNRIWMHHFGVGLVRTPSDFGSRGESPSHPELLDDLAWRFIQDGWSIKRLHRMMLLSRTYRQQSLDRPSARAIDPENRWLWRMNPRRLDWESLRDSILAVGSRLDRALYGRPVQWTSQPISTRRTVYGFTDRQNFPGLFRNFDVANPDQHTPRRHTTTVPQQALFLMNHPFLSESAIALSARSASRPAGPNSDGERLTRLFLLTYQRTPTEEERLAFEQFLRSAGRMSPPREAARVWTWVCGTGSLDRTSRKVSAFREFTHWNGEQWQAGAFYPDEETGMLRLTASGGHPGRVPTQAAIRRWVSPFAGTVSISGTLTHSASGGDGVAGALVSNRQGILGDWVVHNGKAETARRGVSVQKGEILDFVVETRADPVADGFDWAPKITREAEAKAAEESPPVSGEPPSEWEAAADFPRPTATAPRGLTPWDELALTLLLSNEFVFID